MVFLTQWGFRYKIWQIWEIIRVYWCHKQSQEATTKILGFGRMQDPPRETYCTTPVLAYRSTPLKNGNSPAELLMARLKTLHHTSCYWETHLPKQNRLHQKLEERVRQKQQEENFDKHHRAKEGRQSIWISDIKYAGQCQTRSYYKGMSD